MDYYPYENIPDVPQLSLFAPSQAGGHLDTHVVTGASWHGEALGALLDGIRSLRTDHTSGAKDLATKAVGTLAIVADISGSGLIEESCQAASTAGPVRYPIARIWWNTVRKAGWAISKYGRPSMGAAVTVAVMRALDVERLGLSEMQELASTAGSHSTFKESSTIGDTELIKMG